MKRSRLSMLSVAGLIAIYAFLPVATTAQSIWTAPLDADTHVALEWARPEFEGEDDLSFFTSALFITARLKGADGFRVVAEMPISFMKASGEFGGDGVSDVAAGNPYLGIEFGRIDGATWGELGVRIPVASSDNDAIFTGLFADYDRCEAFMPDILSVTALAGGQVRSDSGLKLRFRGGPLVWVDTDPGEYSDNAEFLATYSVQAMYDASPVRVGAGVVGKVLLSEKDLDFKERSIHQLGIAFVGKIKGVEPGLHFRLPLDEDLTDILDFGVGLSLAVPLR